MLYMPEHIMLLAIDADKILLYQSIALSCFSDTEYSVISELRHRIRCLLEVLLLLQSVSVFLSEILA